MRECSAELQCQQETQGEGPGLVQSQRPKVGSCRGPE